MQDNSDGYTLVEFLIAIAMASILVTAIYQIYWVRQKSHVKQQLAVEMQQNVRAAVSLMKREIRMAGFDPAANDGVDNDGKNGIDDSGESANAGIVIAGRSKIQFTFDNDADMVTDTAERITYGFAKKYDSTNDGIADDGASPLGRQTGKGTLLPMAENIQAIGFGYAFDNDDDGLLDTDADDNVIWAYDADLADEDDRLDTNLDNDQPLFDPVPLSDIRAVRIWILARTGAPIRDHFDNRTYMVGDRSIACADNYPRRLLMATVYCRNMGL